MGASNGFSQLIMEKSLIMLCGGAAYNPSELYLDLATTAPTAAAAGTSVTTTQMTNYARQGLTPANWEASSVGVGTITLNTAGVGYTSAPAISFTGGGSPTRSAAATAVVAGGVITSITITNPGSGYTGTPTVVFTGGGFSTVATATANLGICARYTALVDFTASAGGTGGTVDGFNIYDAVTGGNFAAWGPIPSTVFGTNTRFTVPANSLWIYVLCISGGSGIGNVWLQHMVDNLTGKTTFPTAPTLYPALATTAPTPFAHGTEITYAGYPTSGNPRTSLPSASLNAATVVGANVDVVTNTQYNYAACTGTGATATNYEIYDSANVGSGNTVACGTCSTGVISNGLTPDFPVPSTLLRMN